MRFASRSVGLSVGWLVSRPVGLSVGRSVSRSVGQSVGWSASQFGRQPVASSLLEQFKLFKLLFIDMSGLENVSPPISRNYLVPENAF